MFLCQTWCLGEDTLNIRAVALLLAEDAGRIESVAVEMGLVAQKEEESHITTYVVIYNYMIALGSSLRRKLLTYLYSNRSARFYVRQMAGILDVDPTNLSRELTRLEKEGLLQSEVEGRQLYYTVNRRYPYLKPLFTMLRGSVGMVPTLKNSLARVAGIDSAYVYGSFAKNEADASSDIDLLIVGQPDQIVLASEIRRTEKMLRREINYTVFNQQELEQKLKARNPFVTDIWRGKRITLINHHEENQTTAG